MSSDEMNPPAGTPSAPPPETGGNLHLSVIGCLQQIQNRVDVVLGGLPELRIDARNMITRELGIDPSAEFTQIMEKMAHDPVGQGSIRLLARSILSLWILADGELRTVSEDGILDRQHLDRAGKLLPGLVEITRKFGREMQDRLESLQGKEREFLERVGNSLLPSLDHLQVAAVLVPRLSLFAQPTGADDRGSGYPSVNDRSAAWIVSKLKKGKGFPRWGINARALETIILDDLESFRRARDGERKDPTTDGNRVTAFNRLKRDEVAYRVVSERLQTLQNQALVAGNKDRANDLSQAQQPLFSAYLKLAAVLRNPDAEPEDRTQTPINMTQVRKACADGEAVAKAFQDKEKATDNLYLNALKRDTGPAPPAAAVSEDRHRKRERRRFLVLSSVAALLAAVCVLMYVPVLRGKSGDIEVPVSELSSGSGVTRVMAIGPMMYAQVNRRAWDDLTESERIARVNELGESAVSRGFETLYLTDEKRQDLANWTRNGGAKLAR